MDAETEAILGIGRATHELIEAADGTREQHPQWWTSALTAATREALSHTPLEIAAVGVSGQQHGLVCLDGTDSPVRPAKLWNDTTTAAECDLLTRAVGGTEHALSVTGNTFLAGYTAPKVLWLLRHEPANYAATRRMCLPHDYLNLWLTGTFATEPGDASGTAYFDVRQRTYSLEVLTAIDTGREWPSTLPPIANSLSVVGTLREESARALGLPSGIPVSGGGGDNMLAAIGVGAIIEGPVVVSLGSSGTGFAYRSQPAVDPRGEAAAFCDSTGAWLPLVCTLNCTVATDWIARMFSLDHSAVEECLRSSPPGARGLSFLPHLGGERTPNAPRATGVFAGARADHAAADFVRAVVEGVTFGLRYAVDALHRSGVVPSQLTLVGGGAQSNGWAQLCADVFEVPVVRPPDVEAAALGAARQARWAVDGVAPSPKLSGCEQFDPRPSDTLREACARAAHLRAVALASEL